MSQHGQGGDLLAAPLPAAQSERAVFPSLARTIGGAAFYLNHGSFRGDMQ
jgi:hypothetical protein